MSTFRRRHSSPLSSDWLVVADWTVRELLDAAADDAHDPAPLELLLAVEAGLEARAFGAPTGWTGTPRAVAVVRSITALVREVPAAAALRVDELVRPQRMSPEVSAPEVSAPDVSPAAERTEEVRTDVRAEAYAA